MVSQIPEARNGLREGWDTLVGIVLSPCSGAGAVGGVPRSEVDDLVRCQRGDDDLAATISNDNGSAQGTQGWSASIPFEVSASSLSTKPGSEARAGDPTPAAPVSPRINRIKPATPPRPVMARDARYQRSRALLRQLGARHQLASGFHGDSVHGESLADIAHPVTPAEEDEVAAPPSPSSPGSPGAAGDGRQNGASFDFDDGISAISSHTLEDMERRRLARERTQSSNVVRVSALDYSQIIDENTELRFQEPGIEASRVLRTIDGAGPAAADEDARRGAFGDPFFDPKELSRVSSARSRNTSVSEDSDAFEAMWKRDEARYWTTGAEANDSKAGGAGRRHRASGRRTDRPSVDERARRLRELSRSRSRSDGSGSNKSSLLGQHPHDTVPVYTSDLFPRTSRQTRQRQRAVQVVGAAELVEGLDYGEI